MAIFNIHDAKTNLSRLVDSAAAGEEIIIVKASKPVVRLVAFAPASRLRFGVLRGKIRIGEDFDAAMSAEELAQFEGD